MNTERLAHSPAGFLRYMQMSQTVLFGIVEGKDRDPFIYGLICAEVCSIRNLHYKIHRANEISSYVGGKSCLLDYHDYLKNCKALTSQLGGKTTHVVFFLDKDVDDFVRRSRRSKHIIYTNYYDIQNDIFLHGDLLKASAATASLDPAVLAPLLSDARDWCRQASVRWQTWVILCLLSIRLRIRHQCNYRVVSQVQDTKSGETDSTKVASIKADIEVKSGLPSVSFSKVVRTLTKKVNELYATNQQDKVFKGKWYSALLTEDIARLMGSAEYDRRNFGTRIASAIAATIAAREDWAKGYIERLLNIIDNP